MSDGDTISPCSALVWCEIPVTDMTRARDFYTEVLGAELTDDDSGPNPIAFLPGADGTGAGGHLYPGKPAPPGHGNTVHLAVPGALEATMERVRASGGKVVSEVVSIPAGRFFYALDRDGNSIGLFER